MKPILADLGLVTVGDAQAWAVTSPDDRYRYVLGRMWDDFFGDSADWWEREPTRPLWVFGMLNPSKARVEDDPTVRKVIGFAKRGQAGGIVIVNMMALSETHPRKLVALHCDGVDVVGPHNEAAIAWATSRPSGLGRNIAAWGKIPPKLRGVANAGIGQFTASRPECYGRNDDGSPCHPLMLPYETVREKYEAATA